MKQLYFEMANLVAKKEPFVLATVIACNGVVPQFLGAKMLVRQDGTTIGTLDGGILEVQIEQSARAVRQSQRTISQNIWFNGKDATTLDPIHGGQVEVLLEWIDVTKNKTAEILLNLKTAIDDNHKVWMLTTLPSKKSACNHILIQKNGNDPTAMLPNGLLPENITRTRQATRITLEQQEYFIDPLENDATVYIFGAGHISSTLTQFAKALGFWTVVLDDRPDFVNQEKFSNADRLIVVDNFETALSQIEVSRDSFLVIMTPDPLLDRAILEQALRTPAGYIGMLGTYRKCGSILDELRQQGFSNEELRRIHAPIGMLIDAETPEEIGISIVGELIQTRAKMRN
jgi:xanthine dehydrogenase accessory factor